MIKNRFPLACAALISSTALTQPLHAQTTNDEPAASQSSSGLSDIVVTARKVEERLQDVPVAITALDGQALQDINAVSLSDVSAVAPGLQMMPTNPNGSSAAFISMRGQVQASNLATVDPSVGVYVDGVYWARAYGINANLLDIANVQVLRGPQGTLFGRNTTGGAILLNTNNPDLNNFSGRVEAQFGRFNYKSGMAVVNAPIVEGRVAARLAFQFIDDDGYAKDASRQGIRYGEQSNYAMRAKIGAQLTDTTHLLLSADIFREDRNPDTGALVTVQSDSATNLAAGAEILGAADCFADTAACFAVGAAKVSQILNRDQGNKRYFNIANNSITSTDSYTATLDQETSLGDLKVIGGYRKISSKFWGDYDGSEIRIMEFSGNQSIDQWSAEAQLTGKAVSNRLNYAAGLFYFTEKGRDLSNFVSLAAINPNLLRYDGYIKNKSVGIYGQADFAITDQLTVTGGLRWSQDKKGVTINNGTVTGTIYEQPADSFVCTQQAGCPLTRNGKFDAVSWTIGLDYKVTPDTLLYVKAARAFRSGGVNLRETNLIDNLPPQAFRPEKVTSYEGGLKADLFDRRVRFNIGGYYMVLNDAQRESVIESDEAFTTIAANADRADYWGGEAELTAQILDLPSDRFTVSANAAYVKPKYKSYLNPTDGFDKSRERFMFVAPWQFSVSGNYEHQFESSTLSANMTYGWKSSMPYTAYDFYTQDGDPDGMVRDASTGNLISLVDAQNTRDGVTIPASGTLDGRLALAFGNDQQYEVALIGRNILNNRSYISTNSVLTLGNNNIRRSPAYYGVSASIKF